MPSYCNGKCLTKIIVYKAEITATDVGETKEYIGMTAGTFKKRFANHKESLNNFRYSTETELSKYACMVTQTEQAKVHHQVVNYQTCPFTRSWRFKMQSLP